MPVDSSEFRHALGHFAAEVTVVTTAEAGQWYGITVTSFCSLSLLPPLVLVCIDKRARVHDRFLAAPAYAVNFLAADQEAISRQFARHNGDPFAGLTVREGLHGVPVLEETLGSIECLKTAALDGGDHTIFIGQVEAAKIRGGEPLVYYHGQYRRLERE